MSASNRGKYAEGKFRDACKLFEKSAKFAFHRFPDAHAGSMVTAPADFQTMTAGQLRMVEVKETAEVSRLPHTNFATDQVARMRLWELAGAESWVVVYHTKTKLYRCFRIESFVDRAEGAASWFFEAGKGKHHTLPVYESADLLAVFKFIHKL